VVDVADAAVATPIYFPPVRVEIPGKKDSAPLWLVDGSVVCSDPSILALNAAKKKWGDKEDFRVLSISCGQMSRRIDGQEASTFGGALHWIQQDILSVAMDGSFVATQLSELLGPDFLRVDYDLPAGGDAFDLISPQNIEQLRKVGRDLYQKFKPQLVKFFEPPKPRAPKEEETIKKSSSKSSLKKLKEEEEKKKLKEDEDKKRREEEDRRKQEEEERKKQEDKERRRREEEEKKKQEQEAAKKKAEPSSSEEEEDSEEEDAKNTSTRVKPAPISTKNLATNGEVSDSGTEESEEEEEEGEEEEEEEEEEVKAEKVRQEVNETEKKGTGKKPKKASKGNNDDEDDDEEGCIIS